LIKILLFGVLSKLVIGVCNWGGSESKSIFFGTKVSFSLKGLNNSIIANNESVRVNSKV
jgi:hypothetical protein